MDLRGGATRWGRPRTPRRACGGTSAALPDDIGGLLELDEDGVTAVSLDDDARAAGVRAHLAELVRTDAALPGRCSRTVASCPTTRSSASCRAPPGPGIVSTSPANVHVAKPIVLRWRAGAPRALVTRTLVVLEDGANASIVEELVPSVRRRRGLAGDALRDHRDPHGRRRAPRDGEPPGARRTDVVFQHRHARIGEGADLRWALAQLGARLVRSRVDNVLAGDRSSVEQVEIVFGGTSSSST